MNPSPHDYEIRKAAAEKAAELDPDSSEVHDLLASLDCEDWKWTQAEEELQRAIALNPNRAEAHDDFGIFLTAMGRVDEGAKEQEIAQRLDPNVDHMAMPLSNLGKYDESIRLTLRDLERQPDDGYAYYGLFQTYALAERYPEAVKALEQAQKFLGFEDAVSPLDRTFKLRGFNPRCGWSRRRLSNYRPERKCTRRASWRSFTALWEIRIVPFSGSKMHIATSTAPELMAG